MHRFNFAGEVHRALDGGTGLVCIPDSATISMTVMFIGVLSQSMTKSVSAECQLTNCGY